VWTKKLSILAIVVYAVFICANFAVNTTPELLTIKGAALVVLGRYEEALQAFDKAIELDPQYADAWNNKGVALYELGRYKEALQAYDKAIELDPYDADAWNDKGTVLGKLGRHYEAQVCYDKAKELGYTG